MSKTATIKVPAGIATHAGVVTEVILREPTYDEYIALGEIVTWARAPDGTIFTVENADVLRGYIEKCMVQPKDHLLLSPGGFTLARQVKNAILGFFQGEASDIEPSKTSPTT